MPKLVRQSVQRQLKSIAKDVERLDRAILDLVRSDDDWKQRFDLLKGVPGVGDATAAALVAELPELGRLNRQADLRPRRGRPLPRRQRATAKADAPPAAAAASSARRSTWRPWPPCDSTPSSRDSPTGSSRQGKQGKVVIVACMRKLLVILNTMVKHNSPWRGMSPA